MDNSPALEIVVDEPGWAFDRWTAAVAPALDCLGLRTRRYYRESIPNRIDSDMVLVCWWPDIELINSRLATNGKVLCRVTDNVTWNRQAPKEWQAHFRRITSSVHTFVASSKEIENELRALQLTNVIRVGDCVDNVAFAASSFTPINAKPTIGWCGNPNALNWMGFEDLKGFSIVKSLHDFPDASFRIAVNIPFEQMPQWYKSIDVLVCAAKSEGTPLPILEAMASGKIIVSTAVGIVPELHSPGVFVYDGSVSGLWKSLRDVMELRSNWSQLGRMNRQIVVEEWSPSATAAELLSGLAAEKLLFLENLHRVD